jgi:hypothetical protein
MRPATKARWLNDAEWQIATSVFRSNLPFRRRILVTDACGIGDAPFTIPSAALHAIPAIIAAAISGAAAYTSLLVHELTHVWQGHNSVFALSYVINSAFHQCRGSARGGGRGAAYSYSAGLPWRAYNAEQQAEIVEDWYEAGMPESGELWRYIRNNVRLGFIGDHLPV